MAASVKEKKPASCWKYLRCIFVTVINLSNQISVLCTMLHLVKNTMVSLVGY